MSDEPKTRAEYAKELTTVERQISKAEKKVADLKVRRDELLLKLT